MPLFFFVGQVVAGPPEKASGRMVFVPTAYRTPDGEIIVSEAPGAGFVTGAFRATAPRVRVDREKGLLILDCLPNKTGEIVIIINKCKVTFSSGRVTYCLKDGNLRVEPDNLIYSARREGVDE